MTKNEEEVEAKDPHVPFKRRAYDFFKTVLLSVYPDAYPRFSERRYSEGLNYFFLVAALMLLVTGILLAVSLPRTVENINGELDKIETLKIDVNMQLKDDITLAGGKIRISEEGKYDGEKLLVTKQNTTMQNPSCIMFSPACWFGENKKNVNTTELSNVLQFGEEIKSTVSSFAVIMYPALVIGMALFVLVESIGVVLLMFLLALLITKGANLKLSRRQGMLICIYASTVFMLGEPFNFFAVMYMGHLIITAILVTIGVALVGEKKHRY